MTSSNSRLERLKRLTGDITQLSVDAIVNAANESLLGGGGVDGAIHLAAGPELVQYCRKLGGCKVGEAKITPGFKAKAKWIIHTVGPRYGQHSGQEPELLADCYRHSLALARDLKLASIAFPAISTGIFAYPKNEADEIATATCQAFLSKNDYPKEVILIAYRG